MMQEGTPRLVAFEASLSATDVRQVFGEASVTSFGPLSPLASLLAGPAGPVSRTSAAETCTAYLRWPHISQILARPDLRLALRIGGRDGSRRSSAAYWNEQRGLDAVVSVAALADGAVRIQYFESILDFLAWIIDTLGSRSSTTVPNHLPPMLPLESFIYALHAVDSYRRVSDRNLLAGKTTLSPFISMGEFQTSLRTSLHSSDLGWLLPAFLTLTPGVRQHAIEPVPDHVRILWELALLSPSSGAGGTPKDALVFGEAGIALGNEFAATWHYGIGIETAVTTRERTRVLDRIFWAPTAMTNHFVSVEIEPHATAMVNHQPLTMTQLGSTLFRRLNRALAGVSLPSSLV